MNSILVYMDCCCLNRPYDDQTHDIIRIESDAILAILFKCLYGTWSLIGSDIIEYEIAKTPDFNKKDKVMELYKIKKEIVKINDKIIYRAKEIQNLGLKPLDSLHFASAEYRNVDALLTVDKEFIQYSKRVESSIKVVNPINWYMEEMENE